MPESSDESDEPPVAPPQAEGGECPTPSAHKRLHEGHRWWHGCLDSYDNPRDFQVNLNACLQALRNVTFVLQKEKHLIEGFAEWYPPWQEKMRDDPLMRWLVKSRNRVVKEGDLDLLSKMRLRIAHDYFEIANSLEPDIRTPPNSAEGGGEERVKTLPPFTAPNEYIKFLQDIPTRYLEQSSLLAERRWVDKALPDHELLDALAHCYGVLAQILADAHQRSGTPFVTVRVSANGDTALAAREQRFKGRLPCMVVTADVRTTHYRFLDGSLVDSDGIIRYPSGRAYRFKRARYATNLPDLLASVSAESARDYVDAYFEQAKSVLSKDKVHSHIVMLFRGAEQVDIVQTAFADRQSKFLFSQQLAKRVLMTGADGLLEIGEVWQSRITFDEEGAMIPPGDAKEKSELLQVYAETSDGKTRHRGVTFRKRLGRIYFGSELSNEAAALENNMFAPTRVIWATRSKESERQQVDSMRQSSTSNDQR